MLLVAADAVQRLGEDYGEAAGTQIGEELLEARPFGDGAADRVVGVDVDDLPALPVRSGPADPDLVVDGLLGCASLL